jgi:hypothetical protein
MLGASMPKTPMDEQSDSFLGKNKIRAYLALSARDNLVDPDDNMTAPAFDAACLQQTQHGHLGA